MEQQRAMLMGGMGMGGQQGTGIFPNTSPGMAGIISPPQAAGSPTMAGTPPDASTAIPATGSNPVPTVGSPAPSQAKPGIDTNYLNQVKAINPLAATLAENMIAGTFEPEAGKGQNDPLYVAALAIARRADPTFNAQSMIGRPAMVKNAVAGKMYNDQVNLNSTIGHLYDLNDAINGLNDQAGYGTWENAPGNILAQGLATDKNKGLQQFKQVRDLATEELAKFYGGGTSSDSSRKTAQEAFDENQDPNVLRNQVVKALGMIDSRYHRSKRIRQNDGSGGKLPSPGTKIGRNQGRYLGSTTYPPATGDRQRASCSISNATEDVGCHAYDRASERGAAIPPESDAAGAGDAEAGRTADRHAATWPHRRWLRFHGR